ncbi:Phosphatidate phosphatase PAH1 [Camellia lanceoleosa]|uniref:Phosphatidate phosphatase PAH1 n=1 Tax=Camellia lanceoleosa TaxID=1840588 RepID=A0ACC0HUU4_9ERIC|nr:Phosphatidate phosphatase PAH1 [Camellia lanceoleosa]
MEDDDDESTRERKRGERIVLACFSCLISSVFVDNRLSQRNLSSNSSIFNLYCGEKKRIYLFWSFFGDYRVLGVDIIVVQQQDGTFRSAPWSNASAVLNDSGSLVVTRQDSSISDNNNVISERNNGNLREQEGGVSNGEVQLQDEHVALGVDLSEMTESDSERRFYEFPDDQSSLDDSGELAEYGSNRWSYTDSTHLLIETNTDILQLSTPQFHLGPGQEADFVEGNADLGEETWAADYLGDLGTSAPEVASENSCSVSNAGNAVKQLMEVCEGDGSIFCRVQEVENVAHQNKTLCQCHNEELEEQVDKTPAVEVDANVAHKDLLLKMNAVKGDCGTSDKMEAASLIHFEGSKHSNTLPVTLSEEVFVDSESGSQNFSSTTPTSSSGVNLSISNFLRTNCPHLLGANSITTNLKEGQNMVDAHIYLWKWNARNCNFRR